MTDLSTIETGWDLTVTIDCVSPAAAAELVAAAVEEIGFSLLYRDFGNPRTDDPTRSTSTFKAGTDVLVSNVDVALSRVARQFARPIHWTFGPCRRSYPA